jgi:hypothetical protein
MDGAMENDPRTRTKSAGKATVDDVEHLSIRGDYNEQDVTGGSQISG